MTAGRVRRQRKPGQPGFVHVDGTPLAPEDRARVVCCTRPGKWGNPYPTAEEFGPWLAGRTRADEFPGRRAAILAGLSAGELDGRLLACWCGPGPCHTDTLVEWVNRRA